MLTINRFIGKTNAHPGLWLTKSESTEDPIDHITELCPIVPLNDVEKNLDAGRFKMFTLEARPHVVLMPKPCLWFATEQKLDWIAERVAKHWSLDLIDDTHLKYSFDEITVAVLFKLIFQASG